MYIVWSSILFFYRDSEQNMEGKVQISKFQENIFIVLVDNAIKMMKID